MTIKQPTPPEKIYTDEFAKDGESKNIPNNLQENNKISWLGGFTNRYAKIPIKEKGLNFTRQILAGIIKPISKISLNVESYQQTRFIKADSAILANTDIKELNSPALTNSNLNAETGAIIDFNQNLIKPEGKTIITDLTQNAGVIKGVASLTIADKAKSVNIILNPNTSKSVLNNTPPDEAKGKELINVEWVRNNYSVAPSPYIHTFEGNLTTIPYEKIRGLNWVKVTFKNLTNYIYNTAKTTDCYRKNFGGYDCRYIPSMSYVKVENNKEFCLSYCGTLNMVGISQCSNNNCDGSNTMGFLAKYNDKTQQFLFNTPQEAYNVASGTISFSINGND